VSGRGRGRAAAEEARDALLGAGAHVDLRYTSAAGAARELAAAAAAEGFDRIGAVGGDGTLSDIGAGLAGTGVPMAIIPAGTGNDLCRSLAIPRAPAAAARLALHGAPHPLDLWRANEETFLLAAGIGLDAEVAHQVNRGGRLRGMPAYAVALVRALRSFRPVQLTVTGNGHRFAGRVMLAALANGLCYGGGIPIAPQARPDDGLLDVVVVGAMSKAALAVQFPRLLRGAHLTHPQVTSFRASQLRIEGAPETRISLDGELRARLPLVVSRHPSTLFVIVPERQE
jgi:diacylglycerol kinase (ATP)